MNYEDEKLIKLMNQRKAEQSGNIYTGVYMKGDLVKFQKMLLFEEKMSVMLPETFTDMPENIAKLKYLMEQRPKIIKTNEDGSINFTFNLLEADLISGQVSSVIKIFQNAIKATQPSNIFYEEKMEKLEQFTVGWFDFKSHGIDQKIYNIMYCLPIEGKAMHGIFNCPMTEVDLWKPYVLEVIRSIKDLTIEPIVQEAVIHEG